MKVARAAAGRPIRALFGIIHLVRGIKRPRNPFQGLRRSEIWRINPVRRGQSKRGRPHYRVVQIRRGCSQKALHVFYPPGLGGWIHRDKKPQKTFYSRAGIPARESNHAEIYLPDLRERPPPGPRTAFKFTEGLVKAFT